MFGFNKKTNQSKLSTKNEDVFANLKPGDIAIDCGANVGVVTAKLLERGATVYAFEPNPYAFAELKKKFGSNQNANLLNKGVHDHDGKIDLYLHENSESDQVTWSTGSSRLEYKTNVDKDRSVEVEIVDLTRFIQELDSSVKLLKIDVEGVEFDILEKLIETGVAKGIDQILVETHEEKIPQLQDHSEYIRKLIEKKGLRNINLNWI